MSEWMKSLKSVKELDALIARTTPEELSGQVAKLNELYRGLLGAAGAPYLERIRKANEWPQVARHPGPAHARHEGPAVRLHGIHEGPNPGEGDDPGGGRADRGPPLAAPPRPGRLAALPGRRREGGRTAVAAGRPLRRPADPPSRTSTASRPSTPSARTAATTAAGSTATRRPIRATCCCGCRGRDRRLRWHGDGPRHLAEQVLIG